MALKAFEQWFEDQHATEQERTENAWLLEAIRAHTHWGQGKEVSEADYNEAAEAVRNIKLGGGAAPKTAE